MAVKAREIRKEKEVVVLNYGLEVEPSLILWEIKIASLTQGSANKNSHALCMWYKSMTETIMLKTWKPLYHIYIQSTNICCFLLFLLIKLILLLVQW